MFGYLYCVFSLTYLVSPQSWWLSLPGMISSGVGVSIFWAAQIAYVTLSSSPTTVGLHSGIYWMIVRSADLVGNIFSALILTYTGSLSMLVALVCSIGAWHSFTELMILLLSMKSSTTVRFVSSAHCQRSCSARSPCGGLRRRLSFQ